MINVIGDIKYRCEINVSYLETLSSCSVLISTAIFQPLVRVDITLTFIVSLVSPPLPGWLWKTPRPPSAVKRAAVSIPPSVLVTSYGTLPRIGSCASLRSRTVADITSEIHPRTLLHADIGTLPTAEIGVGFPRPGRDASDTAPSTAGSVAKFHTLPPVTPVNR